MDRFYIVDIIRMRDGSAPQREWRLTTPLRVEADACFESMLMMNDVIAVQIGWIDVDTSTWEAGTRLHGNYALRNLASAANEAFTRVARCSKSNWWMLIPDGISFDGGPLWVISYSREYHIAPYNYATDRKEHGVTHTRRLTEAEHAAAQEAFEKYAYRQIRSVGRPNENRVVTKRLKLTPEEDEELNRKVEGSGLTWSQYVRNRVLDNA